MTGSLVNNNFSERICVYSSICHSTTLEFYQLVKRLFLNCNGNETEPVGVPRLRIRAFTAQHMYIADI